MKKIISLMLFLVAFLATNSFALYIDVVPTSDTINAGQSNFINMYYKWDSNADGNFDSNDGHSFYNNAYYKASYAGQFQLTFKESQSSDPLYSSFGFCIDLTTSSGSGTGTLEMITTDELKEAAWLVNNFWSPQNSAKANAGLQMAIWDVLYSDLGNIHNVDRFQVDSFYYLIDYDYDNDGVVDYDGDEYEYHRDFMKALSTADLSGFDSSKFRFVDFDENLQNMLTAVPEPGTMMLLGFGLIGIAAVGRRRK